VERRIDPYEVLFAFARQLPEIQGDGDFMDRPVDALQRFATQRGACLLQQVLRGAELGVRITLLFVSSAVSSEFDAQQFARGLDMLHGGNPMSLVVVIGRRKGGIGLAQQVPRSRSSGEEIRTGKEDQADNGGGDKETWK